MPTVSTGTVDDRPHRGQHPGMKDTRSNESCRTVRVSAGIAEQDLLVGDQPAQPDAVHADALDVGAAGPGHLLAGGVGDRRGGRRPFGRPRSGERWCSRSRTGRRPCPGGAAR